MAGVKLHLGLDCRFGHILKSPGVIHFNKSDMDTVSIVVGI